MKINIKNAVRLFFPNPSLEMIYYEAVANSMDAGATIINIDIDVESFSKPETLSIKISDNGCGFTEKNFEKFSKLLETEVEDHKGIGRLVYLNYFNTVEVNSNFDDKSRTFIFNGSFNGKSKITANEKAHSSGSILTFTQYNKKRINSYGYLKPNEIKQSLLIHFFPIFYSKKINNESLCINISLNTKEQNTTYDFYTSKTSILTDEIPNLEQVDLDGKMLDLFGNLTLFYSISENYSNPSLVTAICAEGRTIPVDLISKESLPQGYDIVFLLYSNFFEGKVNPSRQGLTIEDHELRMVKKIFREKASEILNLKIPSIKERNIATHESLSTRFPHLQGYFDQNSIGLIDRNKAIEVAQKKFFQDQKEILEATNLSDRLYEKSLEISSRILTEYILYRQLIINKLKEIDKKNPESDIHDLIIPQGTIAQGGDFINHLYTNNIWLLDDKYMTYTTVLSEQEMNKLIKEIVSDEEQNDDESRPDIAIVFSNPIENSIKVDVVVVELKKLGLKLAKKEEVVSQLRQRARRLLKYYPNKIQRIWFYGIVDFDDEFRVSLKEDGYTELFSKGQVFYKEQPIIVDESADIRIPVGLYIMSIDAFLDDADSRNATFLNLLKHNIANNLNTDEDILSLDDEVPF